MMKLLYRSLIVVAVLSMASSFTVFAETASEDKAEKKTNETTREPLQYQSQDQAPTTQSDAQSDLCNKTMSESGKHGDQKVDTGASGEANNTQCDQSPVFTFDHQLSEISLEQYTGKNKWTVVEIWASDCHQCNVHMPSMVEFDGKLENVDIVGITLDGFNEEKGVENARAFVERHGITFDNILSTTTAVDIWMKENVGEGLIGTPTFIVIDPDGKIRAAQAGVISTEKLEKYILGKSS